MKKNSYIWTNLYVILTSLVFHCCGVSLHSAVINNDVKMVEELLSKGKNIDKKDENGCTPLMIAVQNNNIDMGGLLLSKGADVNVQSDKLGTKCGGYTAIMIAAREGYYEFAKLLIEKGANVNLTDFGWSALVYAACAYPQHLSIAKLLIDHGAKIPIKVPATQNSILVPTTKVIMGDFAGIDGKLDGNKIGGIEELYAGDHKLIISCRTFHIGYSDTTETTSNQVEIDFESIDNKVYCIKFDLPGYNATSLNTSNNCRAWIEVFPPAESEQDENMEP